MKHSLKAAALSLGTAMLIGPVAVVWAGATDIANTNVASATTPARQHRRSSLYTPLG